LDLAVRRKAIVIEDDSGVRSEILVLMTSRGVLTPLLNYVLHKQQEGRSYSWMDRTVRAVGSMDSKQEKTQQEWEKARQALHDHTDPRGLVATTLEHIKKPSASLCWP